MDQAFTYPPTPSELSRPAKPAKPIAMGSYDVMAGPPTMKTTPSFPNPFTPQTGLRMGIDK